MVLKALEITSKIMLRNIQLSLSKCDVDTAGLVSFDTTAARPRAGGSGSSRAGALASRQGVRVHDETMGQVIELRIISKSG